MFSLRVFLVAIAAVIIGVFVNLCPRITDPISFDATVTDLAKAYVEATYHGENATNAGGNHGDRCPLDGVVMVITGGTSGIGQALAEKLHGRGANVAVLGRNPIRLSKLVSDLEHSDEVSSDCGKFDKKGRRRIMTFVSELGDLSSVSQAADEIASNFDRIDFLLNNAGIHYAEAVLDLSHGKYVSAQGYDQVFAVNYLSHFLLTEKLLSLLEKSEYEPRVIHISSSFHWQVDGSDLIPQNFGKSDDSGSAGDFSASTRRSAPIASRGDINTYSHRMRSYGNSKLAQIYHARSLSRRLRQSASPVRVLSICPLWVSTNIVKGILWYLAFPADSIGVSSAINGMFRPNLGRDEINFSDDWISNVKLDQVFAPLRKTFFETWIGKITIVRDHLVFLLALSLILFQNFLFDTYVLESSSPESYDEGKQEGLYEWSEAAVAQWK